MREEKEMDLWRLVNKINNGNLWFIVKNFLISKQTARM